MMLTLALATVLAMSALWSAPAQANGHVVQLCVALDESGSIGNANFTTMKNGLAAAVSNPAVMPHNGSVELTVITFNLVTSVEVAPTVITAANAGAVAAQINAIVFNGGGTAIDAGINTCANEITNSPEFPTAGRQVINVATDGQSNQAAAIAARNAAVAASIDQVHFEAIGFGVNLGNLLTLAWPQPSELVAPGGTPSDPENKGFVMQVNTFADFAAAIEAKVKAIVIPDEPPVADCVASVNPNGNNEPRAGQKSPGQNEDGFYQVLGEDPEGADVEIYVTSNGLSGAVFGPYAPGDVVKITEATGATPSEKKMGSGKGNAGAVTAHLILDGDAVVTAVDPAGNVSDPVTCLVPRQPK